MHLKIACYNYLLGVFLYFFFVTNFPFEIGINDVRLWVLLAFVEKRTYFYHFRRLSSIIKFFHVFHVFISNSSNIIWRFFFHINFLYFYKWNDHIRWWKYMPRISNKYFRQYAIKLLTHGSTHILDIELNLLISQIPHLISYHVCYIHTPKRWLVGLLFYTWTNRKS